MGLSGAFREIRVWRFQIVSAVSDFPVRLLACPFIRYPSLRATSGHAAPSAQACTPYAAMQHLSFSLFPQACGHTAPVRAAVALYPQWYRFAQCWLCPVMASGHSYAQRGSTIHSFSLPPLIPVCAASTRSALPPSHPGLSSITFHRASHQQSAHHLPDSTFGCHFGPLSTTGLKWGGVTVSIPSCPFVPRGIVPYRTVSYRYRAQVSAPPVIVLRPRW